jgi:hypothetical protein
MHLHAHFETKRVLKLFVLVDGYYLLRFHKWSGLLGPNYEGALIANRIPDRTRLKEPHSPSNITGSRKPASVCPIDVRFNTGVSSHRLARNSGVNRYEYAAWGMLQHVNWPIVARGPKRSC